MTIETQYNINDLVQHKYARTDGLVEKMQAAAYEVLEIHANLCYTTAQVYYICRPLHLFPDTKFGKELQKLINVSPGFMKDIQGAKFREDELKPCNPELAAEIKKGAETV